MAKQFSSAIFGHNVMSKVASMGLALELRFEKVKPSVILIGSGTGAPSVAAQHRRNNRQRSLNTILASLRIVYMHLTKVRELDMKMLFIELMNICIYISYTTFAFTCTTLLRLLFLVLLGLHVESETLYADCKQITTASAMISWEFKLVQSLGF